MKIVSNRVFWAIVLVLIAGVTTFRVRAADWDYQGQNTGRWQFFFSPRVRRNTFLVDTANGRVRQMVESTSGEIVFQDIPVAEPPVPSNVGRYKLFFGAIAEADTFLLDTLTGKSWQLKATKEKDLIFEQVPS